jgi:cyanophycin synthetase
MTAPVIPDPGAELRVLDLRVLRGPNHWALRSLARLDLAIGAYEDISTADVPGTRERLLAALPPLATHECSVGRPGGFVERMIDGTYVPHVIEHTALALQDLAGHEVGFGRARDGMAPREYVVVVAFRHATVGVVSLSLARTLVCRAFAGTLVPADAAAAADELRALAALPERPEDVLAPVPELVSAGVIGGEAAARAHAVGVLRAAGLSDAVDVDPAALLADGLPYRRARVAVLLDAALGDDVPEPYRDRDRAERLVTTLVDALAPGGVAIVPQDDAALLEYASGRAARVLPFTGADELGARLREAAS